MRPTEAMVRLGLQHPIIQGPFGGGLSTPGLAAAVSECGGLGSIGAYTYTPEDIIAAAGEVRALTARPFALNLWLSPSDPGGEAFSVEQLDAVWPIFAPLYREFGLEKPAPPKRLFPSLDAQIDAVLAVKPAVFSFIFGLPSASVLEACRVRGIATIGAATTLDEVDALDAAGVDLILATGFEAAGHRPSFLARAEDSLMGTLALTRLAVMRTRRPVIAAGGLVDGAGVRATLALGAGAAQLGTAFLATMESGASPAHRAELFAAERAPTTLTRTHSGRLARGIPNALTARLAPHVASLPPFPITGWLTLPLRKAAAAEGRSDYIALYAGQGAPALKHRSVAALMENLTAAADR